MRNCQQALPGLPQRIQPKNYDTIQRLLSSLHTKYRFTPSTIERNILKQATTLLGKTNTIGTSMAREHTIQALKTFINSLSNEYVNITKSSDNTIKSLFIDNEQELKREGNIPEDDDCDIIAAYRDFSPEQKYLVSADEHFWGYKELIQTHFAITVVEEWNCDSLVRG